MPKLADKEELSSSNIGVIDGMRALLEETEFPKNLILIEDIRRSSNDRRNSRKRK